MPFHIKKYHRLFHVAVVFCVLKHIFHIDAAVFEVFPVDVGPVDEHVALGAVLFWNGGGAWVHGAVGVVFEVHRHMGVAVEQDGARVGNFWQVLVVKVVTVGHVDGGAFDVEVGVVCQAREVEHHLVDFRFTIAAHAENFVGDFV